MAKSYRKKYKQVVRDFDRLQNIYNGLDPISGTTRFEDLEDKFAGPGEDPVYTFFEHCYHLKDWIKEDNTAQKLGVDKFVEDFINNNNCLRVCADLCNASKHARALTI